MYIVFLYIPEVLFLHDGEKNLLKNDKLVKPNSIAMFLISWFVPFSCTLASMIIICVSTSRGVCPIAFFYAGGEIGECQP